MASGGNFQAAWPVRGTGRAGADCGRHSHAFLALKGPKSHLNRHISKSTLGDRKSAVEVDSGGDFQAAWPVRGTGRAGADCGRHSHAFLALKGPKSHLNRHISKSTLGSVF